MEVMMVWWFGDGCVVMVVSWVCGFGEDVEGGGGDDGGSWVWVRVVGGWR
jgi:hypothetical protein